MKVLFATSEIYPLIKTGGLADVSGALPAALMRQGVDVQVLVPGYRQVLQAMPEAPEVARLGALAGSEPVRLLAGVLPGSGVPLLILDYPAYYDRDGGPYQDAAGHDWPDNVWRFGLLSQVAALLASGQSPLAFRPDVLHVNDWQTGLAPALTHFMPGHKAKTIITIHNMAFQGNFPAQTLTRLGLPPHSFSMHGVEFYGHLSFLKAGLFYANHITTVSPTYAREIQTPEFGFGMQGLLQQRAADLTGILNGIDETQWNPGTDSHLAAHYSAEALEGKAACKQALQAIMGLDTAAPGPLLGVVSRLTHQKGLDLLLDLAPLLLQQHPLQLAILGSGEAHLEAGFQRLARQFPDRVGVRLGYDETLSHQIEAGADLFIMPSRFEPCGLNQMYSMRYGTPPLVHATGGLRDSVIDAADPARATGFVFAPMTPTAFADAMQRALEAYARRKAFQRLQVNGMREDFSWDKSAAAYRDVYARVLAAP